VGGGVGAEAPPALPAVAGLVEVLAADIDLVVVVWRDRDRHDPVEPVLQVRWRTRHVVRPHLYRSPLPPAFAVSLPHSANAAGARSRGPDHIRVDRIWRCPAVLAVVDRVPVVPRDARIAAAPVRANHRAL